MTLTVWNITPIESGSSLVMTLAEAKDDTKLVSRLSFKMVERFIIVLKFFNSLVSRPCLLISGLMRPIFIEAGNSDRSNDLFATLSIMTDSSSQYNFMIGVSRMSSGDVFNGAALIRVAISSGEVGVNSDSSVVTGVGRMLVRIKMDEWRPALTLWMLYAA